LARVAIPHRPRSVAPAIKVIEFLHLLERIHAGPKPFVSIRKKLTGRDQPPKRLFDQFISRLHVLEDFSAQHEETSVDARPGLGDMFDALYNTVLIESNHMKAGPRFHADKTGQLLALQELFYQGVKVDVR